jgi:hypothetical protein
VLGDSSPLRRHARLSSFGVGCNRPEGLESIASDGAGKLGILIDGVIHLLEGVEKVEGRSCKEFPVVLGEGVEGLATEVGDVEVRDFSVLAMNLSA